MQLLLAALLCTLPAFTAAAEPFTLEQAIDFALKKSPDAIIAEQRIAAAAAGIEQARAAFLPQLGVQSSYMRTDNPTNVFMAAINQRAYSQSLDFNNVPDADNLNLKGLVKIPLYAGGRNVAGYDAAKALQRSAEHDAAAVQNALAYQVAYVFLTVLKTREFLKAASAAVKSYENNLSIARRRLAGGTALQTEVLDVEVRLAQAQEEAIRAANAQALALRTLRAVMGWEGSGGFDIVGGNPRLEEPPAAEPAQRPELASARRISEAAAARLKQAAGGYLPRISAYSSIDYDKGWEFEGDGTSYTAGAMAEWDVFDGFMTRARVREAQAGVTSAGEQLRKLRIGVALEQEQARLNLQEARERLRVTQAAVRQAEESAKLTRVRFEQGLALSTQLIDAETALTAARVRKAEADADQLIALAALRKAIGLSIIGGNGK